MTDNPPTVEIPAQSRIIEATEEPNYTAIYDALVVELGYDPLEHLTE